MTKHDMHDHELDLIMALASGSLSGAELEAAEATIAACEGCATELAAQRLALQALHDAPAPALTELEAARMRRALRDELGLVTPAPVTRETRPARFSWQRVSVALSAAAVLVLFIAIVPALDLFGGGADDAATVAFATTSAATEELRNQGELSSPDEAGDMTAAESAGGEEPTTTIAAPAEAARIIDFGADPDLVLLQRASQRGLSETGDPANLLGLEADLDSLDLDPSVDICVDDGLARFADSTSVVLGAGTLLEDEVFVVAYVDNTSTTVALVAYDAATCEILDEAG